MIQRWIMVRGLNSTLCYDPESHSTLNCDPESGSQLNVELRPGVTIQCGIFKRSQNSSWNSDPSTNLLPLELRLNKVQTFNSLLKVQRKMQLILTPSRYSMWDPNFIIYPHPLLDCLYDSPSFSSVFWTLWSYLFYLNKTQIILKCVSKIWNKDADLIFYLSLFL